MKKILVSSILCTSILFASNSPSDTYSYEVTPFAAGILTDSNSGLQDNNYFNGGISLAKNIDDSFINQLEIAYLRSESAEYENLNGNTNVNRTFLNAIKNFGLTEKLSAYGLLGVGYQDVTQELKEHEDSPVLNYGVGLKYSIPYFGLAIKGDVRHLIATKNNQNDLMYTLGIGMPLGKRSEDIKAIVPIVEEEPKEKVEARPIVAEKINNDTDNDGVINKLDKCPNTSAGIKVNKDGCVDTIDLNVNFDNNSVEIKPSYKEKINSFANLMKSNPSLTATIEAHTDSKGSDAYNQNLSDRRAISIVNALKAQNIESSRLRAIGYGESQPIATNENEEGKALNRRVTALLNQ